MLKSRYYIIYNILLLLLVAATIIHIRMIPGVAEINNYKINPLPNSAGVVSYERVDTQDRLKCNLSTVSKMIYNMEKDGYEIVTDMSTENLLDMALKKDNETYRLLYNRLTRDFLCISNPLIKNYVPSTYITEESKQWNL